MSTAYPQRYEVPPSPQGRARDYEGYSLAKLARAVQDLLRGRSNNTALVTLAVAPATTTVLTDERIKADTVVLLMPRTASAAVAIGAGVVYVQPTKGSVTIRHDAAAAADREFGVALIG